MTTNTSHNTGGERNDGKNDGTDAKGHVDGSGLNLASASAPQGISKDAVAQVEEAPRGTELAKVDSFIGGLTLVERIRAETALQIPMASVAALAKADWKGAEPTVEGMIDFLKDARTNGVNIAAIVKLTTEDKGVTAGHIVQIVRAQEDAGIVTPELLIAEDFSAEGLRDAKKGPDAVSVALQTAFMEHFDLVNEEGDSPVKSASAEEESTEGKMIGYGTSVDESGYAEAIEALRSFFKPLSDPGVLPIATKKALFAGGNDDGLGLRLAPAMELALEFGKSNRMHNLQEVLESDTFRASLDNSTVEEDEV